MAPRAHALEVGLRVLSFVIDGLRSTTAGSGSSRRTLHPALTAFERGAMTTKEQPDDRWGPTAISVFSSRSGEAQIERRCSADAAGGRMPPPVRQLDHGTSAGEQDCGPIKL